MVDDFKIEALRHTVHEFCCEKKYVTLVSLLAAINKRSVFIRERVTLKKLLRRIGFKYKKVVSMLLTYHVTYWIT